MGGRKRGMFCIMSTIDHDHKSLESEGMNIVPFQETKTICQEGNISFQFKKITMANIAVLPINTLYKTISHRLVEQWIHPRTVQIAGG